MNKVKLPQLIIGGVAKSGTTSIYKALLKNKSFYFPEHKEPYFFSFSENDKQFLQFQTSFSKLIYKSFEEYIDLFSGAKDDQIIGEASTSYLYTSKKSISKILETYSEFGQPLPKMYFILRNPVDRAWSHYQFLVQRGVEELDFEQAIQSDITRERIKYRAWDYDYLEYGKYAKGVSDFIESDIDCRFYLMEDVFNHGIHKIVNDITSDFGKKEIFDNYEDVTSNPSGKPKNDFVVSLLARDNKLKSILRTVTPCRARVFLRSYRDVILSKFLERQKIDEKLRIKLIDYYKSDVESLSELLDRDLSIWLNS